MKIDLGPPGPLNTDVGTSGVDQYAILAYLSCTHLVDLIIIIIMATAFTVGVESVFIVGGVGCE